jgi:circadian clock protein KaiB
MGTPPEHHDLSDVDGPPVQPFHLVLLLTGASPRSTRAGANLREALGTIDSSAIRLTEIDLLSHPKTALDYGIFASPALLWDFEGRASAVLYGDLSDVAALHRFLAAPPSAP